MRTRRVIGIAIVLFTFAAVAVFLLLLPRSNVRPAGSFAPPFTQERALPINIALDRMTAAFAERFEHIPTPSLDQAQRMKLDLEVAPAVATCFAGSFAEYVERFEKIVHGRPERDTLEQLEQERRLAAEHDPWTHVGVVDTQIEITARADDEVVSLGTIPEGWFIMDSTTRFGDAARANRLVGDGMPVAIIRTPVRRAHGEVARADLVFVWSPTDSSWLPLKLALWVKSAPAAPRPF